MYQINPLLCESEKKHKRSAADKLPGYAGIAASSGLSAGAVLPAMSTFATKPGETSRAAMDGLEDLTVNVKGKSAPLRKYLKDQGIAVTKMTSAGGPAYYPNSRIINIPIKDAARDKWTKSIFAHELGHSASPLFNKSHGLSIYKGSQTISCVSAFAQAVNCIYNSDDESRKKIGKSINIAGGVSALPMVAEEIGASIRGTKMLGLKGMDRAKSFIGVGSYLALMFSPAIIYHVSERTRKFLRALKKAKIENPKVKENLNNLKKQDIKVAV